MSDYVLTESNNGIVRISDGAFIPTDMGNVDYINYLNWLDANNTPDPYVPPTPPPATCQIWQLQASLTPDQWTSVQNFIAASNNLALQAFAAHGTNVIPSNSTTLAILAGVAGVDPSTLNSLVASASTISIP